MGCQELLHKIKRKSGEDEENAKNPQSIAEISLKTDEVPLKSVTSIKAKGFQSISE